MLGQGGLWIEGIDVGWPPIHHEENDPLGLGGEVRDVTGQFGGGGDQHSGLVQGSGKSQHAETSTHACQHLAAS